MGDLLGDVDVTIVNNTIYLRGLPAKTLLKDLARIYRYDQHEGEAFFKLIVTGFLIQRATISFNRYFSLEVYSMFARLYNITERGMYKDAVKELVNNDPNLRKYLTPPIPVPAEILDRLKDVNLNLFPYQQEFLNILYNSKYKLGLRGNINSFAPGMGKCFKKGTPILMFDGTIKNVEDVKVGDQVMGWDSKPRKITSLAYDSEMMYRVDQNKNDSYTVNRSHILSLKAKDNVIDCDGNIYNKDSIINIEVFKYLKCSNKFKNNTYGFFMPVEFQHTDISNFEKFDPQNSKSIPHEYRCNSKEVRFRVLNDILNTSTYNYQIGDQINVICKYKSFVSDFKYLVKSLGLSITIAENNNYIVCKVWGDTLTNRYHSISVTPVGIGPYYGFTLSGPDRMFLLGDFTVVHNTASVIACIHALDAVPCIVTAPKSTLDSSWKQSILRFLPKTKPEEVMIIDDYKPTPRWKFLITNYERLAQAYQYASTAAGPVKCLAIDESHNFRYLTTTRSQRLIELVEGLNIETVIPISGTPIKARTSELIPILKILDPTMDDDVVKIFKKMYGGDRYSPIVESVIRKRLSIYIDKEELNESNNSGFPNKEKYNIICTVKNQEAYYISTIKKEMKAYIDSQIPTYAKQQKPNFDKLKELVKSIPDDKYPAEQKFDYVNQVSTKMNAPMSDAGKQAMQLIKQHESALKKAAPDIAKALIITRKMCTSWLQSLLGKAMGIYFVKRRIECSVKMVLDNAKEIGKVIDDGELKTMIFSLYVQPLYSIVDVMKKENINGMVIPGGTDTNALLQQFYNDNTMDFMACTSAIATGTDGIQKACSQLIFCTVPYRAADEDQTIARIYRRGAASKVVKIYYMKLDTPEKNLMDNAYDILEWSAKLFDLAMTLEDENPQGTLKEDYSHIIKRIDQCFDMLND